MNYRKDYSLKSIQTQHKVSSLIPEILCPFRLVCDQMVSSVFKLLMKTLLLMLVNPDKREWIVLVEVEERLELILEQF